MCTALKKISQTFPSHYVSSVLFGNPLCGSGTTLSQTASVGFKQVYNYTQNHHKWLLPWNIISTRHDLEYYEHCCGRPTSHSLLSPSLRACHCHYSTRRKDYQFPQLRHEDLAETFVRGSGPGGQAVNQTANCVVLKHIPTGTVVKCHETRSLDKNRKIARMRLEEKLDFQLNGNNSYLGQQKIEQRREKMERKKKAKDRLAMKKAFKEQLKGNVEWNE